MILHRSEPPSERKRRSDSSSRRDADWDHAVLPPRGKTPTEITPFYLLHESHRERERDRVILRQSNQRRETRRETAGVLDRQGDEPRWSDESWRINRRSDGEINRREIKTSTPKKRETEERRLLCFASLAYIFRHCLNIKKSNTTQKLCSFDSFYLL